MALGGTSYDGILVGRSNEPSLYAHVAYVALTSVTNTDLWYWGKGFDPVHMTASSVQFSTDGKLLIAHVGGWEPGFIVAFDVASGNVLSSRSLLSSNGFSEMQYNIKSMAISSGTSSMAYVLSNYRTNWDDAACLG